MSQQQPYGPRGAQRGGFGGPQQFGGGQYGAPRGFGTPQFGAPASGPPSGPPQQGYRPLPPGRPPRRGTSPGMLVLTAVGALLLILGAVFIVNALMSRGGDVPYENENYTPPPVESSPEEIPIPQTESELQTMLYANPINDQSVSAPIRCEVQPTVVGGLDPDEVENHFNELTGCLMTTWIEPMTEAGWTLYRPSVTVYEGSINTPCGDLPEMNAVYCPGNQQLYFSMELAELPPLASTADRPATFDMTIAHEFGHAIQGRTGQLAGAVILQENLSESEALKMSRMREAQADCYAGLFINSAAQSVPYTAADAEGLLETSYSMGSDVLSGDPNIATTHPRGETRRYWTQMGLSTTEIGRCNTYVVSDDSLTD